MFPLNLNDDFSVGSAFRDKEGKWTYVFANATGLSKSIAVNNPLAGGRFDIYR